MDDKIEIERLADRPDALPRLITLFEENWPGWYGPELHSAETDLVARSQREALPLGLVAFCNGAVAGTAALTETSGGIARPPLPWLGGLLVDRAYRRRGVASALLRRALVEAHRLDYRELLALTAHADALFRAQGWSEVETVTLPDGPHRIYLARTV